MRHIRIIEFRFPQTTEAMLELNVLADILAHEEIRIDVEAAENSDLVRVIAPDDVLTDEMREALDHAADYMTQSIVTTEIPD